MSQKFTPNGSKIAHLRKLKNIKQSALAGMCAGLSERHLQYLEKGERKARVETLQAIASKLGVSWQELVHEDGVRGSRSLPAIPVDRSKLTPATDDRPPWEVYDQAQIRLEAFESGKKLLDLLRGTYQFDYGFDDDPPSDKAAERMRCLRDDLMRLYKQTDEWQFSELVDPIEAATVIKRHLLALKAESVNVLAGAYFTWEGNSRRKCFQLYFSTAAETTKLISVYAGDPPPAHWDESTGTFKSFDTANSDDVPF